LPPASVAPARSAAARKAPTPLPRRVLIVEDDADSLEALMELCRRAGHTCLSASNRAEALAMLISRPPDAVLLDLMLPDANGAELLRVIRTHQFPIRVAVVTAADSSMVDQVKHLDPDAVFRKPLDFAAVRRWLSA
jgi:DNA-binding response OmpR family regulator